MRRHHDLIAQHEVIDDRVMAVELPAPRLGSRRRPHHRDVVPPFAVLVEVVAGQLGERLVEAHDVARLLQARALSAAPQQPERQLALAVGHLEKADTLANVEALVHPLPPLRVVHREDRLSRSACVSPARNTSAALRTAPSTRRWSARRRAPILNLAVRGEALEGVGEAGCLGFQRQWRNFPAFGRTGGGA